MASASTSIRRPYGGIQRRFLTTSRSHFDNPVWTLNIVGHTNSIGKAGYNQKLSAQRAASVKAALVKRGIDPSRLAAAGAGPGQPKADNTTLTGRALNRRVELTRTDR